MRKSKRTYKDSVFVDLFGRDITAKENFISLYNALSGSRLTLETTELTALRLEQVLYHGFYNDVSFLVNKRIVVLIEHQSTINENLPLRFLLYLARLYEQLTKAEERYSRSLKKIPTPECYVLYNGEAEYPEKKVLKLSDSFIDRPAKRMLHLELQVAVLNINTVKRSPILNHCQKLVEYSFFVERVRSFGQENREAGFEKTIRECIRRGVLKDYLERKASEVINMLLTEYDYETDVRVQREEARREGVEEGLYQGLSQGLSQGSRQAKIETARKMKQKCVSVQDIADFTGLALSEIKTL